MFAAGWMDSWDFWPLSLDSLAHEQKASICLFGFKRPSKSALFHWNLLSNVLYEPQRNGREDMGHALPLECVGRLTSKNIEVEDFTIHASSNPSYKWWGSVYTPCLVLDLNPALKEPTAHSGRQACYEILVHCSMRFASVEPSKACRSSIENSSPMSNRWVFCG